MNLLIVVQHHLEFWNVPAWFDERLRQDFPQVQLSVHHRYDGIEKDLLNAEVVFTLSLRPSQFAVARHLRWIHAPSAAVHLLMFPELVNSEVVLTNSREVHGPVVAEHVIALIFALAKKIPQAMQFQKKHEWGQDSIWNHGAHPREIAGATLGLIGVGSIGARVAKLTSTLGMRVIAVREHVEKAAPEGVEAVFAPPALNDMLRQSDYVVIAAPLIGTTKGLMDADRFAAMKPGACLINVGRGPQVDNAALIQALREHRIAGAALDVFDQEPLPPDSPLWDAENLLITPHTAGFTEKLWFRQYELFSDNLRRYLAGQPLQFVVDKHKGY